MSGSWRRAQPAGSCPLDGGVRHLAAYRSTHWALLLGRIVAPSLVKSTIGQSDLSHDMVLPCALNRLSASALQFGPTHAQSEPASRQVHSSVKVPTSMRTIATSAVQTATTAAALNSERKECIVRCLTFDMSGRLKRSLRLSARWRG